MRNKNLKRFLTTASALGMIAIGAQGAHAGAATNTGGATAYTGGLNGDALNWVNFAGAHVLTIDADANAGVAGAFVGSVGASIAGDNHLKIGSIAGANAVTIDMANNQILTLTGTAYGVVVTPAAAGGGAANNYSGLGAITLAGAGAGLTIAATVDNVTFTNDILAAANNNGVFVVAAGAVGNVFTGDIGQVAAGANALASTSVQESVTFKPAAGKQSINLGATTIYSNKVLTIDSANAGGLVTNRGTINGNGADDVGGLVIKAVAQDITITDVVGGTKGLNSVVVDSKAKNTHFAGVVVSGGGGIVVKGAGTTTFTGAVTTTNSGNFDASQSSGVVTFGNAGTIHGTLKSGGGQLVATGALRVGNNGGVSVSKAIEIGAGGIAANGVVGVDIGALDLSAANAASTFANGLTVTDGDFVTGTGKVTVAGAATTIDAARKTMTLGGQFETSQHISFTNGGILNLQGNKLTLTAGTISNADILGTSAAEILVEGNATLSDVNVGYNRATAAAAAVGTTPKISVNTANTLEINTNGANTNHIYSAIQNTRGAPLGAASVVQFAGNDANSQINLYKDIGEAAGNKGFATVNIGQTRVDLLDGAKIYTEVVAGGADSGRVRMTHANARLGLIDGSVVNGTLTPTAANQGEIIVNTIDEMAQIQYADTTTSGALNSIVFNHPRGGVAAKKNGLLINSGAKANTSVGTELSTQGIVFGNNVLAADMTGLAINLADLSLSDSNTKLTIGGNHIAVANTKSGRIEFTRSDNNKVKKVTFNPAGNNVGTANQVLGLLDASGAQELEITAVGNVYIDQVDAATLTLNGGTYGINVLGSDKIVNIAGADATLVGINDASGPIANIGTAKESIKEFNFASDNSATVSNGVNIYAKNIVTQTNGHGTFTFTGTSTISAEIANATKKLRSIAVSGANADVTFQGGDIYVSDTGITFNDANAKATFQGNIHGAVIGTFGNGIATFGKDSSSVLTVDGIVGNGITLANTKINGTLNLTRGSYGALNTTFLGDGVLNLTKDVIITALGAVTTAADGQGTVNTNRDYTVAFDIGTPNNNIKAYNIGEKKTLIVDNNINVYAKDITGKGAAVAFNSAGGNTSNAGNLGAADAYLASVTAAAGGNVIAGDIFANDITIGGANTKLTAKNFKTTSPTGTAVGANATAVISHGGSIVKATGVGNVQTSGDATVAGLANTGTFTLNGRANNVVTVTDNAIAARDVAHQGGTLKLTKDTRFDGTYTVGTAAGAGAGAVVLDLGSNSFTSTGAVTVHTALTLNVAPSDGKALIIAPVGLTNNGLITIVPDEASFATGSSPIISVTSTGAAIVPTGAGRVVVQASEFTKGAYNATNGVITWTTSADTKAVLGQAFDTADTNTLAFGDQMTKVINAGVAKDSDFYHMLQNRAAMTADEKVEWATGITNAPASATSTQQALAPAVVQSVSAAANVTTTTIADRSAYTASTSAGVASGDAAEKFGVWTQIMGGRGTQKERKNLSGFTSNMMGAILGADTMLNDKATVGVLVGNVNNNVKFKDAAKGDKTKANSWVFGLYGSYDGIADTNFFAQGNFIVAQTAVKSNTRQLAQAGGVRQNAKSKYDILGLGAEIVGGYKFKFDNSYVAPTAGLRYNYFGDTSYTQTGLTNGNQTLKTKATSVVSAVAGVRLGTSIDMDGTNVMPEVHANVNYAFNSPASKTTYSIKGLGDTVYKGPKAAKFGANFGAGVMAEADGFEYGVGYDANMGDKYLAHQGSLKVKVKF